MSLHASVTFLSCLDIKNDSSSFYFLYLPQFIQRNNLLVYCYYSVSSLLRYVVYHASDIWREICPSRILEDNICGVI